MQEEIIITTNGNKFELVAHKLNTPMDIRLAMFLQRECGFEQVT